MSADERRESVIRAAITAFARGGYDGTSTETIARAVGVSQPYLFRLFPSKQAMFLAAAERCLTDTMDILVKAGQGEEPARCMAEAYGRLIAEDPDKLLMQMQTYAAVAAAEAAGDREFGASVRASWARMWDEVHLVLGADADETKNYFAHGMLINTLTSLGFPPGHRVWSCFWDDTHPPGSEPATAGPGSGAAEAARTDAPEPHAPKSGTPH
ncbi:TetR/AcrR family transcriptional regulator [Streptomyces sp. NBC_00102]|uniref:TetR/AcrR family transcriptional regulator n=1 Tax=Streptomyces sp. NBC_00102 TaxID=2975652 RepID=UPI00224E4E79|nr:TetR/AcrR family transcriptional regulator [Streptomyces sp. NBC_00102]MCX5397560.1 TetR/AcrR family transcriptional regulator [Streptomyces sp. NBC_00102]